MACLIFHLLNMLLRFISLVSIIDKCLIRVKPSMLKNLRNWFIVKSLVLFKFPLYLIESIFLLLLMNLVENHGFIFWSIKVKHFISFKHLNPWLRMIMVKGLRLWDLIMEDNLLRNNLNFLFIKKWSSTWKYFSLHTSTKWCCWKEKQNFSWNS